MLEPTPDPLRCFRRTLLALAVITAGLALVGSASAQDDPWVISPNLGDYEVFLGAPGQPFSFPGPGLPGAAVTSDINRTIQRDALIIDRKVLCHEEDAIEDLVPCEGNVAANVASPCEGAIETLTQAPTIGELIGGALAATTTAADAALDPWVREAGAQLGIANMAWGSRGANAIYGCEAGAGFVAAPTGDAGEVVLLLDGYWYCTAGMCVISTNETARTLAVPISQFGNELARGSCHADGIVVDCGSYDVGDARVDTGGSTQAIADALPEGGHVEQPLDVEGAATPDAGIDAYSYDPALLVRCRVAPAPVGSSAGVMPIPIFAIEPTGGDRIPFGLQAHADNAARTLTREYADLYEGTLLRVWADSTDAFAQQIAAANALLASFWSTFDANGGNGAQNAVGPADGPTGCDDPALPPAPGYHMLP